ncbi:MAG: hypothetical protein AB7L76_10525 [Burkholderiaceae bacterium]
MADTLRAALGPLAPAPAARHQEGADAGSRRHQGKDRPPSAAKQEAAAKQGATVDKGPSANQTTGTANQTPGTANQATAPAPAAAAVDPPPSESRPSQQDE